MIKRLLILSLFIIPLYEVILYFLVPGISMPLFPDMRVTKDFVSWIFAIGIGSAVLFDHGFKPIKYKWVFVFLIFLVFNIFKAPMATQIVDGVNFNGMWNYQPVLKVFIYLFLFCGVATLRVKQQEIFKAMMYSGLIMAGYMLFQKVGIDQIFTINKNFFINGTPSAEMGGFVGHPTLSAPFVVMCIPTSIYFKKWFYALIMAVCVALSQSAVAIAGMALIPLVLIVRNRNKLQYLGFIIVIALLIFLKKPDMYCSSGRFNYWPIIFNEYYVNGKTQHLTGIGLGSFKYLFGVLKNNQIFHAHNEYLQVLFTCGIAGLFIFIMVIKDFVKGLSKYSMAIVIPILFIALGTFPLQLAVFQYYLTVVLASEA